MDVVEYLPESRAHPQRRRSVRYEVQCRARIVIAKRHYAGYINNISRRGAKLRTITPIRKIGEVLLRLPDLPPIRCRLRWTDSYNAGVEFESALSQSDLLCWAATRSAFLMPKCFEECEIREVDGLDHRPQQVQFAAVDASTAA